MGHFEWYLSVGIALLLMIISNILTYLFRCNPKFDKSIVLVGSFLAFISANVIIGIIVVILALKQAYFSSIAIVYVSVFAFVMIHVITHCNICDNIHNGKYGKNTLMLWVFRVFCVIFYAITLGLLVHLYLGIII